MPEDYRCEDCFMTFDSSEVLLRHKQKFCVNSKYANLDTLTNQFQQMQQGKDISIYGRPKIAQKGLKYDFNDSRIKPNTDLDREYRQLLRQIGDRQDLRNKLQRQKLSAQEQLSSLQKKQKELVIVSKRKELDDILKRRQELVNEEDQLQKQIRNFEKQRKEQSRIKNTKVDEDFVFREGREAGKLAMQRRILEQKKREIQTNIKQKRREQQKLHQQIDQIKEQPVYIPEYRKKQSNVAEPKRMYTENPPQKKSIVNYNNYQKPIQIEPPIRKPFEQSRPAKPSKQIEEPYVPIKQPRQNVLQGSMSKKSNASEPDDSNEQFLKAALFAGKQKTLFESLNPKGKSDEDIFIESLVAQEYDALNLLARLPKDSQLYQTKLKQFQQMSKIRQDLKDKVQKVRLQKVKREFQMEKQMTQTEKANLQWLDKNRQNMLNRQVNILNNNHMRQQQQLENSKNINQLNSSEFFTPNLNQNNSLQNQNNPYGSPSNLPSDSYIPQKQQLQSDVGLKGFTIAVKSVKNYNNKNAMCVKLMIIQQGLSNAQWTFTTKYHDQSVPKDDRNPFNPGVKNRLQEDGQVIFNQSFQLREDLQSRYNSHQADIHLWIMLMEKDNIKMSNEPELYTWYCFKLTHFGQIRQGTFTLGLYHDKFPFPDPSDMNRMKNRAQEEIVIELSENYYTKEKPVQPIGSSKRSMGSNDPNKKNTFPKEQPMSNTSINNTLQKTSNRRGKSMKAQSTKKLHSLQNINQEFYIENEQTSDFQAVKAGELLNLDFSIIGMRTLPSYIGPLKLQISFMDCDEQSIIGSEEVLSQFGLDMYNPEIRYSKQIRDLQFPASTVVIIKILSISTLNYEPGLVGMAYFHLFFDDKGAPIELNDARNCFLINGYYQLPIYWGATKQYLTMPQLQQNFPTIPCTSMLIHINSMAEKPQEFADYSQGVYNTIFFQIEELQYRLFQQQMKRQKLNTREYVNAYYKFKGLNTSGYKQQQLKKLLSQVLAFNEQNLSSFFVLHAMAQYSSSFGIKFAIDIINTPASSANYYYFCTACFFPPANFYRKKQTDLDFFYKIDLATSLTQELILKDQLVNYSPKYDIRHSLIIELNRVKLNSNASPDSAVETCAYTVLPLFDLDEQVPCANVGIKEIEMIEGQFQERDIKTMEGDIRQFYESEKVKKKSQFKLILRVLNGYFPNQLPGPETGSNGKPLRTIFQNSKGFKSAQESIKKIIQDTYGIQLH